ncbi:unnamed protein product [Adineta steineri]|uniref:Uncharacterized protein n=1 Tax=Adineta steineri TaxID=433720 RepID=A0A813W0U7_9BILA|nr:unnamed protein product [Adineta steineri]
MWTQEALDHLNKEINKTSRNKIHILDYLAYITSQKIYYETMRKNQTLTKQERKGDINTNDKQNLKLFRTVTQTKNAKINNSSNEDLPIVSRFSRLIETVTNLSMITAEDLQICE